MSTDPELEKAAANILKPIDDLLAKEANELEKIEQRIESQERKIEKLFPPAKLDTEK